MLAASYLAHTGTFLHTCPAGAHAASLNRPRDKSATAVADIYDLQEPDDEAEHDRAANPASTNGARTAANTTSLGAENAEYDLDYSPRDQPAKSGRTIFGSDAETDSMSSAEEPVDDYRDLTTWGNGA